MKIGLMRFGNIVALTLMVLYAPLSLSAEDWITEEILQQLSEIRRDVNELKADVEQLKKVVSTGASRNGAGARTISLDNDPVMGDERATVAIVEFTDYQCPFCRRFHLQTLPKLREHYIDTGKVQYVLRDFPLGFHSEAISAANAANCAGKQGAYWEMNHEIFKNQTRLGSALYEEIAANLKLSASEFQACMKDRAQIEEIEADLLAGEQAGVSGTPSFFIGRIEEGRLVDARMLSGAQSFDVFARAIDSLLN